MSLLPIDYLREAIEQVIVGDPHVMEHDKAIIDTIKAYFGTAVTDCYPRHDCVVVLVSNRNDERMDTMTFTVNVKLGPTDCHVS